MGSYKVIAGQNIYDVALHVHGSVEGITDLLVSNESLSLDDDLRADDMLFYTDDYRIDKEVSAYYQTHGITPASGELHVYPKSFTLPLTVELYLSNEAINAGFAVSGHGKLEIDWGDNSAVETITVDGNSIHANHLFDSPVGGKRKVLLYMEGCFKLLDFSELLPFSMYILKPVYVERFVLKNAALGIDSLPLLSEVYDLCLDGLKTDVLTPLLELKGLMTLSLCGTVFRQPAIDAYLTGLVRRHDNRRSCRVLLECEPSGGYREPAKDATGRYMVDSGMEAIWVLTHEPAWNEGAPWEFIINNRIYKYEQNDSTNL